MMTGGCHCGTVTLKLGKKPDYINLCDCTLCAKSGGAWGYFSPNEVKVSGSTRSYRRHDFAKPAVEVHFCPNCGTTTHWVTTENIEGERVGVNMRVFDPQELIGIEVRTLNGRGWTGETPPGHRRPPGIFGKDVFL